MALTEDDSRATCSSVIRVHGTCVELGGEGVVLLGPSGSGKSDLALRLIDGGAKLVADDQVELRVDGGRLVASPPATIAGLLEVRGVGIVRIDHGVGVVVRLLVDLVAAGEVERLPEPAARLVGGVSLPVVRLFAFEVSAAAKVRLAMRDATRDIMPPP